MDESDCNINPDSPDSMLDLNTSDENASACRKRKIIDYSKEAFKEIPNNKIKLKNKTGGLLSDKQNENCDLSCDSMISLSLSQNNKIEKNDENSSNRDIQISATDMAKVNAPHALIWFFFTKMKKDQYKAVCNICKVIRNIPTGTTTTLQNHLKRHITAYNEYSKLKELRDLIKSKNKIKENSNRQMSLKNSLKSTVLFDSSSKKAQEITKTIAMFICKGLHAYSIVEEPAFKNLIFLLEPRYVIPSRPTFSRSVIPKLYENLKQRMFNTIKSAKTTLYSVCMTTDLWTSRSGDSYIAFTLQFLDEDFVMQHMTVDCQPFPGKHDCIAICDEVENVISELDLLDEKIKIYIVSDNGANNVKALGKNPSNLENDFNMTEAVNRKSWEHILCYNHTLQLTISDTRKEMSANGVIEKVSNIVARYNRSKSARESLEHFQTEHNIPKHDLIQMVCTRWDSEFLMLERFVEQKFAIISEQHKAGIDGLTVQEWKLIEGYVEVLRSIANFTAEMGSRSKPTLSMVLPVIFEIKSSLEDIIKNAPKGTGILFARKLLANIKLRFTDSKYWESPLYRIAMLLDPRFKNTLLNNKDSASLLEEKAIEKLRENTTSTISTFQTTNQTKTKSLLEVSTNRSKWEHIKKKADIRNMNAPDEEVKIKIEVENYLKSPTIEEQEDPLTWWRTNALIFPFLAPLARHYLAIAATETSSERVFSVGGNVITNKRTNLLAENVRQIIFCYDNLTALDGVYFEKR